MRAAKLTKISSAAAVLAICTFSGPASATTVGEGILEAIVLEEDALVPTIDNTRIVRFLLECLCDAITGRRGAGGTASAEGGPLATTPGHPPTNWFGDTGFLSAVSDGSDSNLATAFAQNKPRGKVVEAGVTGTGSAEAFLTWNGDVKWIKSQTQTAGIDTANDDTLTADDVLSATVTFTYSMEDTRVSAGASGSGAVGVEFAWNGETTFNGGADFSENTNDGAPSLSGDLGAFSGSFSNSDFSIESADLDISQEVTLALSDSDILSFFGTGGPAITRFDTGEFTASFAGSMFASASGAASNGDDDEVPEPETLFLFAAGLLGIGLSRRLRRKPANA